MDKMFIHGLNPQHVIEWSVSKDGKRTFVAHLINGRTYYSWGKQAEQMIELFQQITIGKGAYNG
jgi:hypothetical protein